VKYVWCDGRRLEVREVGPVIFALSAGTVPIKPAGGGRVVADEVARDLVRELLASRLYRKETL
jgi:hypothetical protein